MAVVVHPGDAATAEAAVLAACWFRDLAGAANVVWVEDDMVKWVAPTRLMNGCVSIGSDSGGGRTGAEVGEKVRESQKEEEEIQLLGREGRIGSGDEEDRGAG